FKPLDILPPANGHHDLGSRFEPRPRDGDGREERPFGRRFVGVEGGRVHECEDYVGDVLYEVPGRYHGVLAVLRATRSMLAVTDGASCCLAYLVRYMIHRVGDREAMEAICSVASSVLSIQR